MTEVNSDENGGAARVNAGAEVNESSSFPTQLAALGLALVLMTAAGIFATIALGITPDDFAPGFTGDQNLVSEDSPSSAAIPVFVAKDFEVPPGWWCFDQSQLAEAGLTGRRLRDDQLLCLVPDVFTGTSNRIEAAARARALDADGARSADAAPPTLDRGSNSVETGVNWAGWLAGICGLLGVVVAALTQHEKFPWSASSKLARAKARRALSRS